MSESHTSKIQVPDVKAPTFKGTLLLYITLSVIVLALLEFIYCNKVTVTRDLAQELLILSDKYSFVELRNACEKYYANKLTVENFVETANMAEELNATQLIDAVVEFGIRNKQ